MFKIRFNKGGVALLIVLGTLLIVTSLATVILSLILSHRRLTYHQTSRIQAYYAAQAGMNYALEMLRTGGYTLTTSCATTSCCISPCTRSFDDGDFRPASIVDNSVSITIIPYGSSGCTASPGNTACVSVKATYTYTAP
jgi:hypothetical protein